MSRHDSAARVWAVIPAAGQSRRMGRPKQVMPFRGSTFVGTVVRTLLDVGTEGLVVVTRSPLLEALHLPDDPRIRIALNDQAGTEMIDSVRMGLALLAGEEVAVAQPSPTTVQPAKAPGADDGVLIAPADMPTLSPEVCRICVDAYVRHPQRIVIAAHGGRRGHPMIFPFSLRSTVNDLSEGLNALSRMYPERVDLVEVNDANVTRDVDTLADYDDLATRDRPGGSAGP